MPENDDEEMTTIAVSKAVVKWLESLKLVEEEPYNKVLMKIRDGEIKKW